MKRYLFIVVAVLAMMGIMVRAEVTVSERDVSEVEGIKRITVKNEYFEMELVPLGAQVVSFKTKNSDRQWLWSGSKGVHDSGHLFMDNFQGQQSPEGELCFIKHEYTIVQKGPEKVEIKFQAPTKEKLRLEKTYVIESGSPVIKVKLNLTNESKNLVTHGLWPNFFIHASGLKEKNHYYRPYERGVMVTGWNAEKLRNDGEDFFRTPYEGWTAALQEDEKEGFVCLMDYNWLKWLYNCHIYSTVEWFYDDVPLPPEKSWATEYDFILLKGFENIAYASPVVVAGMVMQEKEGGVQISHTLMRSMAGDMKGVKLTGKLKEVDNNIAQDLPVLVVGDVGWDPKTVTQQVKVNPDIRLACEVTLTGTGPDGKEVKHTYEYYWPGKSGEKFNLVAGCNQATYYRKPPKKIKEYLKPKDLKYTMNVPIRALELRGPGYGKLKVMEAAARAGVKEFLASYFSFGWSGGHASVVPTSYEQMMSYDLLVLNGVDAMSLTDFGMEATKEFVKEGGALLVIGGFFAYGGGGYADTALEEMLPVKLSGKLPDLERLAKPSPLELGKDAQCLKGTKVGEKGMCYWVHALTPKEGASVEITAGGKPFLVCGTYGKGRIAAICSGPLGNPQKGETPYWDDPQWVDVMSKVINWLVFKENKKL